MDGFDQKFWDDYHEAVAIIELAKVKELENKRIIKNPPFVSVVDTAMTMNEARKIAERWLDGLT